MKIISISLTLLLGLWLSSPLAAQCAKPSAHAQLHANNIQASIANSGILLDEAFIYLPQANEPQSIFSAGLWLGAVDAQGVSHVAIADYNLSAFDYFAGPLPLDGSQPTAGNCANWNKIFGTTAARIAAFTQNLNQYTNNAQAAIQDYPDMMGWPGTGNPHFAQVHGFSLPVTQVLAPFFDQNGDGAYDPLDGDYPVVQLAGQAAFVPDQFVWCVYNDGGGVHTRSGGFPLQVEIQQTAWAFDTQKGAPFSNTIFTAHKVIYRGTATFSDFRMGIFSDFDLGCYTDDYVGCDSTRNFFYAYNQDAVDGTIGPNCGLVTSFDTTPVQSCLLLNRNLDAFCFFNNPSFNAIPTTYFPNLPAEFNVHMKGDWADGDIYSFDQIGYNPGNGERINYVFPSDPADNDGWSMCSANMQASDRMCLGATHIGTLAPGAVNELHLAWTLHPNVPQPCNLGSVAGDVDVLQTAYNEGFDQLVGAKASPVLGKINLQPNPAQHQVVLQIPADAASPALRCYDTHGRLMLVQTTITGNTLRWDVQQWPAGTYFVQLATAQGVYFEKLVVKH